MNTLRDAYDEFRRLAFPDHPHSVALNNWLLDLAETEAYFAGLAESVLSGRSPETQQLVDLASLSKTLAQIAVEAETDKRIYEQCRSYLQSLQKLKAGLEAIQSRRGEKGDKSNI